MGGARLAHLFQRLGLHERRVAIKHDHIALEALKRAARLGDRMGGAQLFALLGDVDHGLIVQRGLADGLSSVAGDHDDARRVLEFRRADGMHQHGRAADLMQNLGQVGVHPRPLPGRQDDESDAHMTCVLDLLL